MLNINIEITAPANASKTDDEECIRWMKITIEGTMYGKKRQAWAQAPDINASLNAVRMQLSALGVRETLP